jgi:hypothetical protein
MPYPTPLDPTKIDAYKLPKDEFDKAYADFGRTLPAALEDQPRDEQGRFTADEFGDAYKKSNREFSEGWNNLGNPAKGDGHPVVPFKRLSAIREQLWGAKPGANSKERETA